MNGHILLRIKIVCFLFFVGILSLCGRLAYWQLLQGDTLAMEAQSQHFSGQKLHSQRGSILASDGSPLVASSRNWLAFAYLPDIEGPKNALANSLSSFLITEIPEDTPNYMKDEILRIKTQLERNDTTWVPLKRRVTTAIKDAIEKLEIPGIGFDPEEVRSYPEGSSSAHLLGFVGKDDHGDDTGYFGLEGYYNISLSGKSGFQMRESNALGVPLLLGREKQIAAQSGVDLITHIDKSLQLLVENELKNGIEQYQALSGNIIIMNPKDGGILAMASAPSYDPTKYYEYDTQLFKNPTISDAFEPGSIFKPLIMAAGIDAGVIEPTTHCDICSQAYEIDKYTIQTWDNKYHEDSTMTEVLMHSDNVGMVFVGNRLGKEVMYDYVTKFGFGKLTEIDLQGEASPQVRKKKEWSNVDLATASFGQGIAVTPIQMVAAMATIARGGIPVTPQVVDKLKIQGWEEDIKPRYGKRAISEKAAKDTAAMMVAAAKSGEAKWAATKGFRVAGKTGTAQIPVSGHYDAEKTIASFIGFAPAEDPKFVMLVTLREPQSSQWASETAAPLWFKIAKNIYPYLGIHPEN